jgi:hypothetical protein
MGLTVSYTAQDGARQDLEFGSETALITFGRSMECLVDFPDDVTSISAYHFSIRQDTGSRSYVYKVSRHKPVFRDGHPLPSETSVRDGDVVHIGKPDGLAVRLGVTKEAPGNYPVTDPLAKGRDAADIDASGRATRGGMIWMGVAGLAAAGALAAAVQFVAAQQVPIRDSLAAIATSVPKAQADALAAEARKSVYLVAGKLPSGELLSLGTAVAMLGPANAPVLATNAHVVELLAEMREMGIELIAVPADGGKEIAIESGEKHPGFDTFNRFMEEVQALQESGLARAMEFAPSYDVGWLTPKDPSQIAATVKPADPKVLKELGAGDWLFFSGFPSEDLIGTDPRQPVPTVQPGSVTAATNFFLTHIGRDQGLLIQHSLPAAGGASGSPIFNRDGELVALLNAGNTVDLGDGRLNSPAQINYAQRIDLVTQLMEGKADQQWVDQLKKDLETYAQSLKKSAANALLDAVIFWKADTGAKNVKQIELPQKEPLLDAVLPISRTQSAPAYVFSLNLNPDRSYVLFAASRGPKIGYAVLRPNGKILALEEPTQQLLQTELPVADEEGNQDASVKVAVYVSPQSPGTAAPERLARVLVFEVKSE